MTNFWMAVALSVITALVYLWSSVQQQKTSNEIILVGKALPVLIFPALLLLAAPLGYQWLGNSDKQTRWQLAVEKMNHIQSGKIVEGEENDIQDLLLALRTSITQEPNNGYLWFMLAESYFQLRMVDLADAAIQKALRIESRPDWFVANAQILSMRSSASDISKSINLLQNALSIQPEHQSALLTLGFVYFRQQQFEFAIVTWRRLLTQLEISGIDTSSIQSQIDLAKQQLALQQRDFD